MSVPETTRSRRDLWSIALPAAVALLYAFGHLGWYRQTPLGQVPVLDEQENLAFAETIVRGELPHEPFYRAPGYALVLAGLRGCGVPASELFSAALGFGALLHGINAALAAAIARRLFASNGAALAAGLLCALNPVLVHFATQALDAVPGLTFFLLGLGPICMAWTEGDEEHSSRRLWCWSATSLCWAVATIIRPNYLLVWCTLPLLALPRRGPRGVRTTAAASGAIVFALVAAWQWRVSGEGGFLPWQGSYNLWAANRPGTHGRYLVQQVSLPAPVARQNPARAESFLLFREESGHAPADVHELNAHWRGHFLDHVVHHPLAWAWQLVHKIYALCNNWEQYNNKTFAFHKARSPWLRWNPLCWGIVFTVGIAGAARLTAVSPRTAQRLALVALACAISIGLFFVSARFRLPLVALLAVAAGGAVARPFFWRAWPRGRRWALGAALSLGAVVAFSSFDRVNDTATFVQDHALLARAAATVGDDALAWTEANAALALQSRHPDALRVAIAAYFNRLLSGQPSLAPESQWLELCDRLLAEPRGDASDLRAVAALALWRSGQRERALGEWRRLEETPSAAAARLLVRDEAPGHVNAASWPRLAWDEPLVRLAALQFHLPSPTGVALGRREEAVALVPRLFAISAKPIER